MFTLPNLNLDPQALEPHIDTLTMQIHHDKHHAAYVKNLNDALPDKSESDLNNILSNLESLPESIRTKVRNNGGGHWNHSFFWTLLTNNHTSPSQELESAINASFESMQAFKEKFNAVGLSRFGSGWVWLIKTPTGLEIVDTPNQDNPLMTGHTPILGVDVWEHAYYLKYQNKRADYLTAIWNVINWDQVSKLYSHV